MLRLSWILILALALVAPVGAQSDDLRLDWDATQSVISGSIELSGSANIADQQFFYVEAAPYDAANPDTDQWTPVVVPSMPTAVNEAIGTWHTAVSPDGLYQVRLTAINSSGEHFHYTLAPIAINNDGMTGSGGDVAIIFDSFAGRVDAPEEAPIEAPPAAPESALRLDWDATRSVVSGSIELSGTANVAGQQIFYIEAAPYDPANPQTDRWTPALLPSKPTAVNESFGTWHTAVTPDGLYQLRLHAINSDGVHFFYTLAPIAINNDGMTGSGGDVAIIFDSFAAPEEPQMPVAQFVENRLPVAVGGHVQYFGEAARNAMERAGMTWVKKQVQYGISDGKDFIEEAHALGYKVLLGALGNKDHLAQDFDGYVAKFAEYVAYLASLGADAIEVWNEPNIDREWPSGQVNGASYARLLRPAYEAIKAVNPDVMVISAAPAPTGFFGGGCAWSGCDDHVFMAQMANAGVARYADCIGAHYNEGILPPTSLGGDPRGEYPTYYLTLMLRRVAYPFRNSDIPMCMTEMGYLSPDGFGQLPAGFRWAEYTSLAEQAQWLADAIQISADFQSMPLELIIVWNIDFDHYDSDPQAGYAIIRPDGSCPACDTIAALQR